MTQKKTTSLNNRGKFKMEHDSRRKQMVYSHRYIYIYIYL